MELLIQEDIIVESILSKSKSLLIKLLLLHLILFVAVKKEKWRSST